MLQQKVQILLPELGRGRREEEVHEVEAGVGPPINGNVNETGLDRNTIAMSVNGMSNLVPKRKGALDNRT